MIVLISAHWLHKNFCVFSGHGSRTLSWNYENYVLILTTICAEFTDEKNATVKVFYYKVLL